MQLRGKDKWPICFLMLFCIMIAAPAGAQDTDLMDVLHKTKKMDLCGENVPLRIDHVKERFEKEMLLSLWDRPQVLLWIKRSSRYLPFITQQLKSNGMPDDLKYLAVAESALRPHAGSSKGAVGFWQLMPQTARKYGLVVNEFVDERRNLNASTQAAIKYLRVLYGEFSSWTLAVAAYNMGEEGLTAEILEQDTKDYYKLYLPLETQRFIFRLLAIKLILNNPAAYGIDMIPEDLYKPLTFDTVSVDCFQEVPLRLVAQASGTYFKMIKDLNPHIRGHYIQAGHHQIDLPQGSAKEFTKRFNDLVARYRQTRQKRLYIIQRGDTLSTIAEKFDVPLAAILIWNRIDLKKSIHPGDRLVIYPGSVKQVQP